MLPLNLTLINRPINHRLILVTDSASFFDSPERDSTSMKWPGNTVLEATFTLHHQRS